MKMQCEFLAAALLTGAAFAAPPPQMVLPKLDRTPKIDGVIAPDEYTRADSFSGFHRLYPTGLVGAEAGCRVGTDGKKLYFAYRCAVGPDGILQKVLPVESGIAQAGNDDSAEIVLAPNPSEANSPLYHFIVNNRGAMLSQMSKDGKMANWRPRLECRGRVHDGFWEFELALPLADIGIADWRADTPLGIRICRNWFRMGARSEQIQSSWSQYRTAFFSTSLMPSLAWSPDAPAVEFSPLRRDGKPDLRIRVRNFRKTPLRLKMEYRHTPVLSKSQVKDEILEFAPGESREIALPLGPLTESEEIVTHLKLAEAVSGKLWYEREFRWNVAVPTPLFAPKLRGDGMTAFRYAYYPSYRKLRLAFDAGTLRDPKKLRKIRVALSSAAGKTLAVCELVPDAAGRCDELWTVPDLRAETVKHNPEGKYHLDISFEGVAVKPLRRTFEHRTFPWEGNTIGLSNAILPPFPPIQIDGDRLDTLLRSHFIGSDGLWKQVRADGRLLLADGGIRLERDGKPLGGSGFRFSEKQPHRAAGTAALDGGLRLDAVYDYDGMMRANLTVPPGRYRSLRLVVPYRAAEAPLFHAVTDSLRINYAGARPASWDSTTALRYGLLSSFCSYIWLGSEGPGLAVFGDNDRGWELDPKIPTQTLRTRPDGAVELVYNLFAKPVELKTPRTLEFGFEATPVKPMPDNWRRMNGWSYNPALLPYVVYQNSFMGTGSCYGTETPCAELYPKDNLELWDEMDRYRKMALKLAPESPERRAYEKTIPAFAERISRRYAPDRREIMKRQISYGFGCLRFGPPVRVMLYTNARGGRPDDAEGRTFTDQWTREEFRGERDETGPRNQNYWIIDPDAAYRDYAAWHYREMTRRFADDLYWDNVCPCPVFSPVAGGYKFPDGRLQCTLGLFNMRELVRRGAMTIYEQGRRPFNMVHMTNTNMAHTQAFAQQNLDWEDFSGCLPFQDRYTREYLRACSIGRQSGNVTGGLGLVDRTSPADKLQVCRRSGAGVALTHEVVWYDSPKSYQALRLRLFAFGYGFPNVRVRNYWEKDYPLQIGGGESSSLLLIRDDGEMLAIVCNYGKTPARFTVRPAVGKPAAAFDWETGQPLTFRDGAAQFELPRYEFKIVQFKPEVKK